jgi:hypothetical protein
MRSSYLIITTLSVLAILFLSSSMNVNAGSYSFASSSKQKTLSLTIQNGGILNAGPQTWTMSGGSLVAAMDTATSDLSSATWTTLHYSMDASVNGLTAGGTFALHLKGTTAAGNEIRVGIHTTIVSAIPAVCFPSYSVTGTCASGDTSEIPAYFLASGTVRVHETGEAVTTTPISLVIEDAALNPFGAPIVISSVDGTFLVVATYDHARTVWEGVQTGGTLTGTLGSTQVSGSFVQIIHTDENYVAGTATDSGQISLVGMSPASLDSNGQFHGTSTIPTTGEIDCSPPTLPGTCTETGYASIGTFNVDPAGLRVSGNYNVQWPAPSITFGGTITAQVPSGSD